MSSVRCLATRCAGASMVLLIGALAGCSASAGGSDRSTQTVTMGTITSVMPTTVTSRITSPRSSAPPPTTDEPAPVPADCPYLSDSDVADINGQHTGQTQIVDVKPYPICVFSRSDGDWLATVRVIQAGSPQAATAAVDAHVPVDSSDPASQPPGWTGGAMVTADRSIYAVSKGPIAVVAESNQLQSIKGRQMVIKTVANLGL